MLSRFFVPSCFFPGELFGAFEPFLEVAPFVDPWPPLPLDFPGLDLGLLGVVAGDVVTLGFEAVGEDIVSLSVPTVALAIVVGDDEAPPSSPNIGLGVIVYKGFSPLTSH